MTTSKMRAKRLTSGSVSAYLGHRAERSRTCGLVTTQGFVVHPDPSTSDGVIVEYEPGTRAALNSSPERLLKVKRATLNEYRQWLALRYLVTADGEDPTTWDKLHIREKGEDA